MGYYLEAVTFLVRGTLEPGMNEDLPEWVILTAKVEIYEAGNKLRLYYRDDRDAIYKLPGAFFGLTPNQIRTAIKQGKAKAL